MIETRVYIERMNSLFHLSCFVLLREHILWQHRVLSLSLIKRTFNFLLNILMEKHGLFNLVKSNQHHHHSM